MTYQLACIIKASTVNKMSEIQNLVPELHNIRRHFTVCCHFNQIRSKVTSAKLTSGTETFEGHRLYLVISPVDRVSIMILQATTYHGKKE
jgi:hypothetical protein